MSYERTGLSVIVDKDTNYDMLGARSLFRAYTAKLVQKTVQGGEWFTFCKKVSDAQKDIMSCKNKDGEKMGSFVAEEYPNTAYRSAIYKYLLRDFLCYYEAPTVVRSRDTNAAKNSFNKYLITSNIFVVAHWLGISYDEANAQYGSRLDEACDDNCSDIFQYVKLYETREHVRKVSKPRKDLDLGKAGTRVVPLYALKAGVTELYKLCCDDVYDIRFMKDGGVERSMCVTFNTGIIKDIYGDCDFYREGVQGQYDGDFLANPSLERGYIRVFEVGGSRYDSPLRSVNYARITGFEKAEPDLTYINIDMGSVLDTFKEGLRTNNIDLGLFVDMLDVYDVGSNRESISKKPILSRNIELWADSQAAVLSTVFLRKLALFMIGNSQWFNGYTGEPRDSYSESLDDFEDIDFM